MYVCCVECLSCFQSKLDFPSFPKAVQAGKTEKVTKIAAELKKVNPFLSFFSIK